MQLNNPFENVTVPSSGGNINVNSTDIGTIISKLLPYIFGIAGIGLLVYLVIAGLQMMMSRGDPKAMQMAQARITTALTGFIVLFLAYSTVKLIGIVFGITVFGTIFR